ncbi:sugar kinase [Kaistia algarum]|uniref:ROK family protein n=1 Tax=Kaistia algarum TaxID=2083279 RepID=UPI000CE76BB0|nr:ROK family protein [Kaistia algarum]MCX5515791.1 ROK family protein [Kaistia algarum]PPE81126.1 sugar kinase [Kaistia algarum]
MDDRHSRGQFGGRSGGLPEIAQAIAISGERSTKSRHSLLTSSTVGSTNRGRVLQALFDLGPTSRADLARLSGVHRTTISGIVQPLIDDDLLVEIDAAPGQPARGKPARPLWFSPNSRPICGVLLMPDAVHACLVTLEGTILVEVKLDLPPGDGPTAPIIETIVTCVQRTLAGASRTPLGIGVAVGGMVDTDLGSIVAVNLAPALDRFPLADALQARFNLPVVLDHHPRALLVGDRWFGSGRGAEQFAVVYTGEVLGGAFYVEGHLYRGAAGAGGELGHTFVQLDGELCRCGRRGCWDTVATLSWLRREARAIGLPDPDAINSARLVAMADREVAGAASLLDRYARNVAAGVANVQQTLAPNVFILHGDVVLGGERMIDAIAGHVRSMVPRRPGGEIEIIAGDAGDQAALLGAAGLVLSDLLRFPI